jgi:hypothetical protein
MTFYVVGKACGQEPYQNKAPAQGSNQGQHRILVMCPSEHLTVCSDHPAVDCMSDGQRKNVRPLSGGNLTDVSHPAKILTCHYIRAKI